MKKSKKQTKVLFVSSEVYPYAKSGGLADVSFGLPKAMLGAFDVSIIMPLYGSIDIKRFKIRHVEVFDIFLGAKKYKVELLSTTYESLKCYFVGSKIITDKKSLYGTPQSGYKDNDLRFGLFCKAVVAFAQSKNYDLLHLNDWQSALCALFIKEDATLKIQTLFTIHNLAYQGIFEKESLEKLGLKNEYFHMDALEFYGGISFMKAGIAYSDAVTTVSPNYAKEILTQEFGCGLEGFLSKHENKLTGILNGVDLFHFAPKTDTALLQNYDATSYDKKVENKKAYLQERNFENEQLPLFIFIGRFTWQKGVDLLIEALQELSQMKLNIAILGEGESKYHKQIKVQTAKAKNMDICFGYDEVLSHKMYASADFLLMPSLFEPCGLNQLISMSYGVIPLVSSVGGLKDSVHSLNDYDKSMACGNNLGYGFSFDKNEPNALIKTIQEALILYEDKKRFKEINMHNMSCDFSWDASAKVYTSLYKSLLEQIV
ncbi:MAG: glycogen/starch synthase [Campylobacterales bacterium]|nr:glycogen/starch synthase [Campylobacterales bacterium]